MVIAYSLIKVRAGWREFAEEVPGVVGEGDIEELGLPASILSPPPTSTSAAPALSTSTTSDLDLETLLTQRKDLSNEIESLKEQIRIQNVKVDNERGVVKKDRMDLNGMIQEVLMDLEENGVDVAGKGGLLDEFRDWGS